MFVVLVSMSLFFIGLAFFVREKNAGKVLSGYNTLSDEDRSKVDLENYIRFFRNFHLFLGLSFLVLGILLYKMLNENVGGIFVAAYPVLAYLFFLSETRKYMRGPYRTYNRMGFFVLLISLLLIGTIFISGIAEGRIEISGDKLEIGGMYGESIGLKEIKTFTLIDELPGIRMRKNGFALGDTRKGYFKTDDGETVKLLLNSSIKPLIMIVKTNGEKIYFSSGIHDNEALFLILRDDMEYPDPGN